jgi:hypothetical protein
MNRKPTLFYLDGAVGLLVQHFGVERVRAALAKVSDGGREPSKFQARPASRKPDHKANPSIVNVLEQFRQKDEEKYYLLKAFYMDMKDGKVLSESQDIRQFAQLIGLKEITGKSRKELVPKLMRFLLEQPTDRLRTDLKRAAGVSEQQRQQGFSVLTDKLLGDK